MGKRKRQAWYQYHLDRYVSWAQVPVLRRYEKALEDATSELAAALELLRLARARRPLLDRLWGLLGVRTRYLEREIIPAQNLLTNAQVELRGLKEELRDELRKAEVWGKTAYERRRVERQEELRAREQRVEERQERRRISYLEKSPALRSASRALKEILVEDSRRPDGLICCFYCGALVRPDQVHLEHKKPLSRGGDNRQKNLALACAACNLSKGRKTDAEFLRYLGLE